MEEYAQRDVQAEMYAVQQIWALRANRAEINLYGGLTHERPVRVTQRHPGLGVNYYIINPLADRRERQHLSRDELGQSDFNFETSRAARIGQPITEYSVEREPERHVRAGLRQVRRVPELHLPLRLLHRRWSGERHLDASDRNHRPGQPNVFELRAHSVSLRCFGGGYPNLLQRAGWRRCWRSATTSSSTDLENPTIADRLR